MKHLLICLFVGPLAWGQAAVPTAAGADTSQSSASLQSQKANVRNLGGSTPVITIQGLCDDALAPKASSSDCKTVITQAEFERVIEAVQPNMPARTRRDFALRYANYLLMTKKAEEMSLDKGPNFDEQMKIARIQILSRELNKAIQEKVSQVSDGDVEAYYEKNVATFQQAEMERIYVPKTRQPTSSPSATSTEEREQAMKDEAETLNQRALAVRTSLNSKRMLTCSLE